MKRGIVLTLFIIFSFSNLALAGFGVSPGGDIYLEIEAGGSYNSSLTVNNSGQEPIRIKIKLCDWDISEEGQHRYYEPGELSRSCANWVNISPMEFEVEGGESQTIGYSIDVPQDSKGSYWFMIDVESHPSLAKVSRTRKIGVVTVGVIGIKFFQTEPTTAIKEGKITDVAIVKPEDEQPYKVAVTFQDTGNTYLRPTGRIEIKDETGKTISKIPIKKFTILPEGKRILEIPIEKKLPAGQYLTLAIIDFEGEFLVAGEAKFEVE